MKILVSQTIARRHAIRQQKKLVHAFSTDLKATGPAGQHKMNCCGPNWPDDQKKCMRASGHIANVVPCLYSITLRCAARKENTYPLFNSPFLNGLSAVVLVAMWGFSGTHASTACKT